MTNDWIKEKAEEALADLAASGSLENDDLVAVESALLEAYRKGKEDMREAAAKCCDRFDEPTLSNSEWFKGQEYAAQEIRDAIRSLPVGGENG